MSTLASFFSADERRSLQARSNAAGLRQLAFHLSLVLLGALGAGWTWGSWLYLPAAAWLGAALVFLFCPQHECIHRTAFASSKLNDWLARIIGVVLILPAEYFRFFHFAHHRYTQDPEKDPELSSPKPHTWSAYLWHLTGLPYWIASITTLANLSIGRDWPDYIPQSQRTKVKREAQIMAQIYAALFLLSFLIGSWALLQFWVIPVLLGQPLLRAFLLAEHTGCDLVTEQESADMTQNTRTTLASWFVRALTWNMSFHSEHHLAPSVPFHALPRVHTRAKSRIKFLSPSYPAVHSEIQKDLL